MVKVYEINKYGPENRGSNHNRQSRDTDKSSHKSQNKDEQNKTKTQHRNLKGRATRIHQKIN
jgi:hypothetical protein